MTDDFRAEFTNRKRAEVPLATLDWREHNWKKLMPRYRKEQEEAVAHLARLEDELGQAEFEQKKFPGEFTGSEACGVCGKRWGRTGMHICEPAGYVASLESRGGAMALALEALLRWRCEYAGGHNTWVEGRELMFEVTGRAESDHKKYVKLTAAIEELEGWR